MNLSSEFLHSIRGVPGFNEAAFIEVHKAEERTLSVRFNPRKKISASIPFLAEKVPWTSDGYYLNARPSFTLDPLFHGGAYYVQEASSMFLEQALIQTVDLKEKIRVLDLCAAPGGKSTLIQSLISEQSLLVSNEVIRSRVLVLEENITKWGASNVIVTNNDARDFQRLPAYFDVLVVDAPCSGSGLFRKDPSALDEWSEANVELCSQRQQRILADVYPSLKENGILIYSTCSYSAEENEKIADWLQSGYQLESIRLQVDPSWGIVETISPQTASYGYRFYPDKVKGEGFFIACFRKKEFITNGLKTSSKKPGPEKISAAEKKLTDAFMADNHGMYLWKLGDRVLALPSGLEQDLKLLGQNLYLKKAGTAIGKPTIKELIPDHELALSGIRSENLVSITLNKQEALQYLRREEVTIKSDHRGWALLNYEGIPLGWIKHLGSRINNYYPKEWRILKPGDK